MEVFTYGNPVLRSAAEAVTEVDAALVETCESMYEAMLAAQGIGLAATQVGIQQRFFVYDYNLLDDQADPSGTPQVLINPVIHETSGQWAYEEGCLSIPGLSWNLIRPKELLVSGIGLDGEEVKFEADELFARLIQHEIDHLDGVLLIDHLDEDAKRAAKKHLRQRLMA